MRGIVWTCTAIMGLFVNYGRTAGLPPVCQCICHEPFRFEGSCSCSAGWLARLQLAPRKPQRHATLSHDQRCATGSLQLLASDCYHI